MNSTNKIINEKLMGKVKKLAERIYPRHNFEGHIIPVVNIALELSKDLNVEKNIVEISAYLHDAGRVLFGGYNHDISGNYYVTLKLWQYGFPKDVTKKIAECVRTHRGTEENPPLSLEAKIIANADALSHFEGALYLFGIKYSNCKDLKETVNWLKNKLEYDLEKKLTMPEVRKIAEIRYKENIYPLLDSMERCSGL